VREAGKLIPAPWPRAGVSGAYASSLSKCSGLRPQGDSLCPGGARRDRRDLPGKDGNPGPDLELRDTESVPLPAGNDPAHGDGVPATIAAFLNTEGGIF
jgi:hypothetical protein